MEFKCVCLIRDRININKKVNKLKWIINNTIRFIIFKWVNNRS